MMKIVILLYFVAGVTFGQPQDAGSRYQHWKKAMSMGSHSEDIDKTLWPRVYETREVEVGECIPAPDPETGDECSRDDSWFGNWLKWCPTSLSQLREAEKAILSNLRSAYKGRYVDIGCEVGNKESYVWTLGFNEESNKLPVVLLHGFASGVGLWCLNYDALAAERPVYAIDILGFGRSSRPQFNRDPLEAEREFITSVEAWRKNMKLDKFVLLGHSFGGFLASSYAIKHPDRVAHLILADPWGFPEKPLDMGQYPLWLRAIGAVFSNANPLFLIRGAGPFGQKLLEKSRPDLIRKFSSLVEDAQTVIPSYIYQCNAQTPTGESAFHSMMDGYAYAKYPMVQRMDSLRRDVPLTLVYGERSWVDRNPAEQIKNMRQSSYVERKVFPGAGHHVYADKAKDFNKLINSIASYADRGEVPPPRERSYSVEDTTTPANNMSTFINVRYDTNRDESYSSPYESDTIHDESSDQLD